MTGELLKNKYVPRYAYVHFTLGGSKTITADKYSLESYLSELDLGKSILLSKRQLQSILDKNVKINTLSNFHFHRHGPQNNMKRQSAFAFKCGKRTFVWLLIFQKATELMPAPGADVSGRGIRRENQITFCGKKSVRQWRCRIGSVGSFLPCQRAESLSGWSIRRCCLWFDRFGLA